MRIDKPFKGKQTAQKSRRAFFLFYFLKMQMLSRTKIQNPNQTILRTILRDFLPRTNLSLGGKITVGKTKSIKCSQFKHGRIYRFEPINTRICLKEWFLIKCKRFGPTQCSSFFSPAEKAMYGHYWTDGESAIKKLRWGTFPVYLI